MRIRYGTRELNLRIPRLRDADRLFRRRRVERRLTRLLPTSGGFDRVALVNGPSEGATYRFVLRKERRRLTVAFEHRRILRDDWPFEVFRTRAGILIEIFAGTTAEVTEAIATLSDGIESGPGIVSFCSTHRDAILVPDSDFYASRGYADFRLPDAAGVAWNERDWRIVWRGSSTGRGEKIATEDMRADDPELIQRTRLCLALCGMPNVDAKLINAVQSGDAPRDLARLRAAGILGDPIDPMTWSRRKFALDVDGNSNAWANLFTRLLLGCCVLKIASPKGYRQWYYDELRPFEHFVPVAADLSDLAEKIEWCRSHDRESADIAAAGREFARRRTYEGELARAVETLNRALGSHAAARV
jgi:glycosyl transferase family 90